MARPEIAFELRNAISKVIKSKQRFRKSGIEIKVNSDIRSISVEVVPLKIESDEPLLLILFTEHEQTEIFAQQAEGGKNNSLAKDRRIKKLEQELAAAHADALAIAQEQEAYTEELQSANEEIVSSNEELQTVNEELETSKEEIESANEELTTTNQELQTRNDLLNEAYGYSEAVFATIHEPMLVLDKNLRVKSANKTFYKIFNVKEEDTEGVLLYDLGNKQWNIPRLRELLEDLLPKNTHFHDFEITHNFPLIGEKTMMLNARRIIQKINHEELILLAISDITEQATARKKIEESDKRFHNLVDSMPQKITNADAAGNVIFYNQQWINETGYTLQELMDGVWKKVMHPDDLEHTTDSWLNAIKTGTIFEVECRILNKELGYRWNLARAVPVKDESGKTKMWIGSTTDIHEQKEAKSKAETAQLVAEDSMQAKQQFLANMSHEIRTPMNAIIGFTNVLLKSKLDKTQEEYLTAIKVSGDALLVLINDILDLAKVDAGKMTFEQTPFNLATSLSAMFQLFDIKIKEKNLVLVEHFDSAIPEIISGDSLLLRQIILNLISNAVKFTDAGKITMRVALLKQDTDKVTIEFTVSDTGIGIHENKLEHIFDDFGQATYENSRLYGGTGLGLSIEKKLIEQQVGSINVKSELGKGSAFSFQLSFGKTNQKIQGDTEIALFKIAEIKNIKVLVAEDLPLNQLLLKIILADFSFEVDIAGNGKIAIEKLQQNKYDIILMDLQMPEMNGFEATEYIRKTMQSQIPIIALTADVTTADVSKCKEFGIDDYISKPINENLLYSKIVELVIKQN